MSREFDEYKKKGLLSISLSEKLKREIRDRKIIEAAISAYKNGKNISYGDMLRIVDDDYSELRYENRKRTFDYFISNVIEDTNDWVLLNKNILDNDPSSLEFDRVYELAGIESRKDEIIDDYGKDVYNKACKVVPTKRGGHYHNGLPEKDFKNADMKLGVIYNSGIYTSPVFDLGLLVEELNKVGIPSYIDYDNYVFHLNVRSKILKR